MGEVHKFKRWLKWTRLYTGLDDVSVDTDYTITSYYQGEWRQYVDTGDYREEFKGFFNTKQTKSQIMTQLIEIGFQKTRYLHKLCEFLDIEPFKDIDGVVLKRKTLEDLLEDKSALIKMVEEAHEVYKWKRDPVARYESIRDALSDWQIERPDTYMYSLTRDEFFHSTNSTVLEEGKVGKTVGFRIEDWKNIDKKKIKPNDHISMLTNGKWSNNNFKACDINKWDINQYKNLWIKRVFENTINYTLDVPPRQQGSKWEECIFKNKWDNIIDSNDYVNGLKDLRDNEVSIQGYQVSKYQEDKIKTYSLEQWFKEEGEDGLWEED